MTKVDELRTQGYETSQALAATWESRRAQIEGIVTPVREWMLRELDPRPGDTVLELAAGVGDTGFEAARIIGDEGRLISTDFSPAMLDAALRRGNALGLHNVQYRIIDAEEIDLDGDSIDGVLCRYGYMLMADPATALSETRRVLRPGGRLALAVWGTPERNPFFAAVAMRLIQRGHMPPPDPERPGIFHMASAERTSALLEQAGFSDVRTEEVGVRFALVDIEEYLTFVGDTAGPVAIALRGLSQQERQVIKRQLEEALAPFASDRGYDLPGVTLAAVAS